MSREKITITLERAKAETARRLLAASSMSAAIDEALDRLIRTERRRADLAAYRRDPPDAVEERIALIAADAGDLGDDTDWEALYPEDER